MQTLVYSLALVPVLALVHGRGFSLLLPLVPTLALTHASAEALALVLWGVGVSPSAGAERSTREGQTTRPARVAITTMMMRMMMMMMMMMMTMTTTTTTKKK